MGNSQNNNLVSQNIDFVISKNNIILSSNIVLFIIPWYKVIILGTFLTHSYIFKFHVRGNYL